MKNIKYFLILVFSVIILTIPVFGEDSSNESILQAPQNVEASDCYFDNEIYISWEKVSGANEYRVYRSDEQDGPYEQVSYETYSKTYYRDTDFFDSHENIDKTFYYKITALDTSALNFMTIRKRRNNGTHRNPYYEEKIIKSNFSDYDDGIAVKCQVESPENVQATDGEFSEKIDITWNPVDGVGYYMVYRSESRDGNYEKIWETIECCINNSNSENCCSSYTDNDVVSGTLYYYRIKAFNVYGESEFSPTDEGYTGLIEIEFEDYNLEILVRSSVNNPEGSFSQQQIDSLRYLNIDNSNTPWKVTSLKGLEHFKNLHSLDLISTDVEDLTPITTLTIFYLWLHSNDNIADYTVIEKFNNLNSFRMLHEGLEEFDFISNLTSLKSLHLGSPYWNASNNIDNIEFLENLTNLEHLGLADNNLKKIDTLQKLIKLQYLDLSYNNIEDISALSGLNDLYYLDLSNNSISNVVPLAGLTNLSTLDLERNNIIDPTAILDLYDNINLQLDWNPIETGIVIFEDSELESLIRDIINKPSGYITDNDVLDIYELTIPGDRKVRYLNGLEKCINLESLSIANGYIGDRISPIEGLKKLKDLDLSHNSIYDISALSQLTQLEYLNLSYNKLKDVSPVSKLENLIYLNIGHNNIIDVSPLANLIQLEELYLDNNKDKKYFFSSEMISIEDISSLANLTKLRILSIKDNSIESIHIVEGFIFLEELYCENNQIDDISMVIDSGNIREFTFRGNPLTAHSIVFEDENLKTAVKEALGFSNNEEITEFNAGTLKILDASSSDIESLNGVENFMNLTSLNLSDNRISDISNIAGLIQLTHLNISNNDVNDISDLADLEELINLDVSYNSIYSLDVLSQLDKLEDLDAIENPTHGQYLTAQDLQTIRNINFIELGAENGRNTRVFANGEHQCRMSVQIFDINDNNIPISDTLLKSLIFYNDISNDYAAKDGDISYTSKGYDRYPYHIQNISINYSMNENFENTLIENVYFSTSNTGTFQFLVKLPIKIYDDFFGMITVKSFPVTITSEKFIPNISVEPISNSHGHIYGCSIQFLGLDNNPLKILEFEGKYDIGQESSRIFGKLDILDDEVIYKFYNAHGAVTWTNYSELTVTNAVDSYGNFYSFFRIITSN